MGIHHLPINDSSLFLKINSLSVFGFYTCINIFVKLIDARLCEDKK
jgi:hypothetical protein